MKLSYLFIFVAFLTFYACEEEEDEIVGLWCLSEVEFDGTVVEFDENGDMIANMVDYTEYYMYNNGQFSRTTKYGTLSGKSACIDLGSWERIDDHRVEMVITGDSCCFYLFKSEMKYYTIGNKDFLPLKLIHQKDE